MFLVVLFFLIWLGTCEAEAAKDYQKGSDLAKQSVCRLSKVQVSSGNQEWALKVAFGFGTVIALIIGDHNNNDNDRDYN